MSTHTSFTQKEILSLTRPERIKIFERIKTDVENETEWKRLVLETIIKVSVPRL